MSRRKKQNFTVVFSSKGKKVMWDIVKAFTANDAIKEFNNGFHFQNSDLSSHPTTPLEHEIWFGTKSEIYLEDYQDEINLKVA